MDTSRRQWGEPVPSFSPVLLLAARSRAGGKARAEPPEGIQCPGHFPESRPSFHSSRCRPPPRPPFPPRPPAGGGQVVPFSDPYPLAQLLLKTRPLGRRWVTSSCTVWVLRSPDAQPPDSQAPAREATGQPRRQRGGWGSCPGYWAAPGLRARALVGYGEDACTGADLRAVLWRGQRRGSLCLRFLRLAEEVLFAGLWARRHRRRTTPPEG